MFEITRCILAERIFSSTSSLFVGKIASVSGQKSCSLYHFQSEQTGVSSHFLVVKGWNFLSSMLYSRIVLSSVKYFPQMNVYCVVMISIISYSLFKIQKSEVPEIRVKNTSSICEIRSKSRPVGTYIGDRKRFIVLI